MTESFHNKSLNLTKNTTEFGEVVENNRAKIMESLRVFKSDMQDILFGILKTGNFKYFATLLIFLLSVDTVNAQTDSTQSVNATILEIRTTLLNIIPDKLVIPFKSKKSFPLTNLPPDVIIEDFDQVTTTPPNKVTVTGDSLFIEGNKSGEEIAAYLKISEIDSTGNKVVIDPFFKIQYNVGYDKPELLKKEPDKDQIFQKTGYSFSPYAQYVNPVDSAKSEYLGYKNKKTTKTANHNTKIANVPVHLTKLEDYGSALIESFTANEGDTVSTEWAVFPMPGQPLCYLDNDPNSIIMSDNTRNIFYLEETPNKQFRCIFMPIGDLKKFSATLSFNGEVIKTMSDVEDFIEIKPSDLPTKSLEEGKIVLTLINSETGAKDQTEATIKVQNSIIPDINEPLAEEKVDLEGIIGNIYPNPSGLGVEVKARVNILNSTQAYIEIYNTALQTIMRKEFTLNSGKQEISFNIGNSASGAYFIGLKDVSGKRIGNVKKMMRIK